MSLRSFASLLILFVTPLSAAAPRVLAWDDAVAARELAMVRGKEILELENLHPSKRSDPLPLRGEGPLFLRALDRDGPEGEPVQLECPTAEGLSHPLMLLMPDEKHPTGLRIIALNDDPAGFRWGTYRFLNATPKALALRLEDKSVRIPSGWKATDLRLTGETRGIGVMIATLENLKRPIYSAVWEHNPEMRTLCFIVPGTDPRLGPIEIKAVPQDRTNFDLDSKEKDE